MLFQLHEIRNILDLLVSSLLIIGYIFIVITGVFNFKREEKLNGSIFLIIIGAVEIVYELLKWRLWQLILYIMGYSLLSMNISHTIQWVIPSIISIITFGIFIIILGKKNKDNSGKKLLLSGIFWIVYSVFMLIRAIIFFPVSLFPIIPGLGLPFEIVADVLITFMVLSRIFLLLYSSRIKEKNLLVASIFLLIASMVFIGYAIVNLIIYVFP